MKQDHSDFFIERVLSKNTTHPGSPLKPELLKFKDGSEIVNMGLTKREYFAAMAMQGVLSGIPHKLSDMKPLLEYYEKQYPNQTMFECIANESVGLADALIEALNK